MKKALFYITILRDDVFSKDVLQSRAQKFVIMYHWIYLVIYRRRILKLKLTVVWDMTPYSLINDKRYFLEMYYICKQDSIISLSIIA
jgi:hypothetical protein